MLVSDIIDRTYSQWLYPAGVNRPAFDTLASGIDNATLTIPLSGRVENIPRDTILEIGSELILSNSVAGATVTGQARGYLETSPATHSAGDVVYVDPKYPRKVLLDTMNILLGDLYGQGVYNVASDTATTYTTLGLITLPTGARKVISILVDRGGTYTAYRPLRPNVDYTEYREFQPPKIQLRRGGAEDREMVMTYQKVVTQATLEADDLDTLGVPTALQPHLCLGIAGYILQSREVPRVQIDEIKRSLAAQGIQVGSALNVGQSLMGQYMRYVVAERVKLEEQSPHDIEIVL